MLNNVSVSQAYVEPRGRMERTMPPYTFFGVAVAGPFKGFNIYREDGKFYVFLFDRQTHIPEDKFNSL